MNSPLKHRCDGGLFLEGPARTGKTTAAARHLSDLLDEGVPARRLLVIVPHRELAGPYYEIARSHLGGRVSVLTISGLARRMTQRFWPLVAEKAGFNPEGRPTFLTLETAQYFMAQVVSPLMEEGAFAGLSILESRLYSQIIDNLNKAAVVGFSPDEIAVRLKSAWIGGSGHHAVFEDAQRAADQYLERCREHNLLDFSLQLRIFHEHLWTEPACRDYLEATYRHVVADNVEEAVPTTHDLLSDWLPKLDSALFVFDHHGGYRKFLGADPDSGEQLKSSCGKCRSTSGDGDEPAVFSLGSHLVKVLHPNGTTGASAISDGRDVRRQVDVIHAPTYPEMIEAVAEEIHSLTENGARLGEVVALAPFLPDTLRYAFGEALSKRGVPFFSRRPSRPLSKEPAIKALLAFTALAHPSWNVQLDVRDVAQALEVAIDDLDPVRAHLLAEAAYAPNGESSPLRAFSRVDSDRRSRITYRLGERYENLRKWLAKYTDGESEPIDHVISRLFGEVLSQEGYGFHDNFEVAAHADRLARSARKFRQVLEQAATQEPASVGRSYLGMVRSGVAAAQYVERDGEGDEEAVLLAPAHTFLVQNKNAKHHFWLDAGSTAWHSRIRQPLTHPHVLSRSWEEGAEWTDRDEQAAGLELLARVAIGLSRRCDGHVHVAVAGRGQHGQKERGYLLRAFQHFFGRTAAA